jgi:hypothetical protein
MSTILVEFAAPNEGYSPAGGQDQKLKEKYKLVAHFTWKLIIRGKKLWF